MAWTSVVYSEQQQGGDHCDGDENQRDKRAHLEADDNVIGELERFEATLQSSRLVARQLLQGRKNISVRRTPTQTEKE